MAPQTRGRKKRKGYKQFGPQSPCQALPSSYGANNVEP